ncbi:MAG: hypothetical protein ACOC1I_09100, partial [Spirochaetota bacterium]
MSTQPDYVSFETRGRDELLSQIGSFSPTERALFERLCASWAPKIDVDRLLRRAETSEEQERTALERLMAKLRTAQIGVLTTRETEAGVEPDAVILTSTGSLVYWEAVVDEAIRRLVRQGHRLLPTEQRLGELKALPPDYHLVEADSSRLVAAYNTETEAETIFRLRLMADIRILFTTNTARPLILRSIQVLRQDLAERGILEELARVSDMSLTETRKQLESKAPDVWLRLMKSLVKERSTIAFRKNIDESDELFQVAYLIMVFVDAQIGAAKEQKEYEQVVSEELATLERLVLEAPQATLTQDEFSALVEDAQSRLEKGAIQFSKRLQDEVLSPRAKRRLPRILYIHGLYIHGSRVRTTFEKGRQEISERLAREYTELMEAFLRGRSPEIGEIWSSRELFNEDIARRVERQHPLVSELLARPQMLAEAVIQDAKQRREGVSTEELKGVLAAYFNVESSAVRPLHELFEVNLVDIFDAAFAGIGVFRQIFLRIAGRYESLRATYIRRFGPRSQPRLSFAGDQHPSAGAGRSAGPGGEPAGTRTRGTGNRSHRPETTNAERRRASPPPPPKPRRKSHDEIEQIWKDFDKAL